MHSHSTAAVRSSPARPPAPGAVFPSRASSAVEAETSQPSVIQIPIATAPISPPIGGGGAAAAAPAAGAWSPANAAATASTMSSAIASAFANRDVGSSPR